MLHVALNYQTSLSEKELWIFIRNDQAGSVERSKTERGRESLALALLAGVRTDIWLARDDLSTPQLRCPGKKFKQEN